MDVVKEDRKNKRKEGIFLKRRNKVGHKKRRETNERVEGSNATTNSKERRE